MVQFNPEEGNDKRERQRSSTFNAQRYGRIGNHFVLVVVLVLLVVHLQNQVQDNDSCRF